MRTWDKGNTLEADLRGIEADGCGPHITFGKKSLRIGALNRSTLIATSCLVECQLLAKRYWLESRQQNACRAKQPNLQNLICNPNLCPN
jgi:hypothetical protein